MALVKSVGEVATTSNKFGGKVQMLRLEALEVDARFQRPISLKRVEALTLAFDDSLVGLLTVSARPGGRYVLIDGQHRWMTLVNRGYDTALCEVLEGLTLQEEASIFHGRNQGRTRLRGGDHFRARLTAGDPAAVSIDKLVRAAGFHIDLNPGSHWKSTEGQDPRNIISITALERLHGAGMLAKTFVLLRKTWPNQPSFFMKQDLLLGIGAFLRTYPEAEDLDDIAARWAYTSPLNVVAVASSDSALVTRQAAWQRVMEYLRQLYNRKRRTGRLEAREVTAYTLAKRGYSKGGTGQSRKKGVKENGDSERLQKSA